jgi:mannose-6-phosphate isomerase-like protein (cupin superfamily)
MMPFLFRKTVKGLTINRVSQKGAPMIRVLVGLMISATLAFGQPPQQQQQQPQTLAQRIGHTDASQARVSTNVHDGQGTLGIQNVLNANAVKDLSFLQVGPLGPKSSIGHHFHLTTEEIFVIFDADAQYTVNGLTAVLPGPIGVPCPAGTSHSVFNPTNRPALWLDVAVRMPNAPQMMMGGGRGGPGGRGPEPDWKTIYSNGDSGLFNLGDDRVNVPLQPVATFINTRQLTRDLARPVQGMNGGKGAILYRRTLGPSVFKSNWAFVDHYILPPGTSIGRHVHNGVEEIYFVVRGDGSVGVNAENAQIKTGDAVPVHAKEAHSFENTGTGDLEFLVFGIALEKGKLDSSDVAAGAR